VITIHQNPQNVDDEYLRCLNVCYGWWGNSQQFYWYFRRKTAYPDPDLIVMQIDGQMAAGSAVSYRKVALPNGNQITVGLVTGAWTLPQFRGRGCFVRLIEESVKITEQRGGALLLGFVREENPSSRQMARLGSALFPSAYLTSTLRPHAIDDALKFKRVTNSNHLTVTIFRKLNDKSADHSRFFYPNECDFSAQFIHRPSPTELLSDNCGNIGIVEKREKADILQLAIIDNEEQSHIVRSIAGFLNHARNEGRQLLLYSTSPLVIEIGARIGFEVRTGYLTVLIADEHKLTASLELSSLLKKNDSYLLAQPENPCFLGPWNLQNGDRL